MAKDIKLREYQQKLIEDIEAELAFGGSGDYFVDSCVSSGKSFMISALANTLKDDVIILINITALLDQIAEHLDVVGANYSILKAGYEDRFDESKPIHLVMSQTYFARQDKINIKAKYIIQDEGHKEFNTPRTMAMINKLNPVARFLFSGTCYDSVGFQFPGTTDTFKTVAMESLIDQGFLAKVKYYVPKWAETVDYDNVKKTGGEYVASSLDEIINTPKHLQLALKSMNEIDAKNKKVLVFCSSIEQCDNMTALLKQNGYYAESFHSKVDKADNVLIEAAFRHNTLYDGHTSERKSHSLFDGDIKESIQRPIRCLVSVSKLSIGFSVEDVNLGVIMRPTNVRSLYNQLCGRIYRAHPSKEYGEILDLGQCVSKFGFAHEQYDPPKRGLTKDVDVKNIVEANKRLSMVNLSSFVSEEPIEVTRDFYNLKVQEARETERKFIEDKKRFQEEARLKAIQSQDDPETAYIRSVAQIINTTMDVQTLISAGAEFWTFLNGQPISKAGKPYNFSADWLAEDAVAGFEKYPSKNNHWMKAYRTRVKNLCKQGKNYNGIKFFINFLIEELEDDVIDYNQATEFNTTGAIDDDIPF